ncbi:MAG: DUF4932 domain-containing protein [Candidatus Zixiibacteriota bacterium]
MRSIERKLVTVTWIVLLVAGFLGSATAQVATEPVGVVVNMEKASEKRFSVTVDPRIELLAVVQHFTSWAPGWHIKSMTAYKEDIDNYFGKFKEHPVITLAESLFYADFTCDAPVSFMLYLGDPPELVQKTQYSGYLIKRAKGVKHLEEFADALRDFAKKTDFVKFYRAHKALYDTLVAEVDSLFEGKDYVGVIEDFYGESRNSYNLILSPLFGTGGGYSHTIKTNEGYDLFAVLGPCSLKGKRTTFACPNFESIMLHEWSHHFVNPLVDQNFDIFTKSTGLFEPIKEMMQRQQYPDWKVALYEHIVRACAEIHLLAKFHRDFKKEEALEYHEGKGFWYISYIDSLLGVYDTHRKEYPTFGKFVPVIATGLSQISVEDLPERLTAFAGPLSAIFSRTDSIHLIYPTDIDEELANKVKKDLENFAAFLSSARIEPVLISDKEAIKIDWQDKVGFIYGNPGDNLFLRELKIAIPLRFRENALEFGGKRYEGEGMILISCMPNPFNKKLPFAIMTANRPEDLIGAGSKISSPGEWNADYVIFRGEEKLDGGLYHKEKGKWSLIAGEKQN